MSDDLFRIPPDSSIEVIPLYDIPESMNLECIRLYRFLATRVKYRLELTLNSSEYLFETLWKYHIYLSVDLKPIIQAGAIPTTKTLKRFLFQKSGFIEAFDQLGITKEDFEDSEIDMPHPSTIDLTFNQNKE